MTFTPTELYGVLDNSTRFEKSVTDVLLELDNTTSVTTQASLNEMLVGIYRRLENQNIIIDVIGDSVSPIDFKNWVNENFDDYTVKLFNEEVEK